MAADTAEAELNGHLPESPPGAPEVYPDQCPFCGEADLGLLVFQDQEDFFQGVIQCKECKALGPIGDSAVTPLLVEPSAVAKWNSRKPFISLPENLRHHADNGNLTILCGQGV